MKLDKARPSFPFRRCRCFRQHVWFDNTFCDKKGSIYPLKTYQISTMKEINYLWKDVFFLSIHFISSTDKANRKNARRLPKSRDRRATNPAYNIVTFFCLALRYSCRIVESARLCTLWLFVAKHSENSVRSLLFWGGLLDTKLIWTSPRHLLRKNGNQLNLQQKKIN